MGANPLVVEVAGLAVLLQTHGYGLGLRQQPYRVVNCGGILEVDPNGSQREVRSAIDPNPLAAAGGSREGRQNACCRRPPRAWLVVKGLLTRQVPSGRGDVVRRRG